MKKAPSLAKVERGDLCTGCGACSAVEGISMSMSQSGFLRPDQTKPISADADRTISKICPGLSQTVISLALKDDALWGPYHTMRTGAATDPALRYAGASGGALSALLCNLLETGKVDGVVQIKADRDNPLGNRTIISRTASDIFAAAGSRYAPSAPLACVPTCVSDGQRYAFVGKPCDVAALRTWREIDPGVADTFPVLVSFFCAGVPSQFGARELLKALQTPERQLAAFRYRGQGWPGRATATLNNGTQRSMSYHESWGRILSKHVQHRCKICADGTGVAADIVCADAWDVDEKGYPTFEERDGVSLIVSRTGLGEEIVAAAMVDGAVTAQPFDAIALERMQPGQVNRRRALAARLLGLRLLGLPVPRYRGLGVIRAALQNPAQTNIRNCLGMVRRGARKWLARRQPGVNQTAGKVVE